MDALLVGFLVALWACTSLLAYGMGWLRGHEISDDNHRWHRWMLKREQNRSHRF
jgi:hypothetical protein